MSRGKDHYKRGRQYYDKRDYENALAEFEKAITFGERTLEVYGAKAAAQCRIPRWRDHSFETARLMVEKFGSSKDGWQAYHRLALCLKRAGLYTGAETAITDAYSALKQHGSTNGLKAARSMLDAAFSDIREQQTKAKARAVALGEAQNLVEVERVNRAKLEAKRSRTNYIHILPRDLLVEVCHWGLVSNPNFGIVMGRVCHDWRVVMDSTTGVWGKLLLSNKKPVAKAEAWLKRSGGKVQEVEFKANFPVTEMDGLGQAMGAYLDHVRILTIQCQPAAVCNKWRGRMKRLKRLAVNPPGPSLYDGQPKGLDLDLMHPDAGGLREVELWDMSVDVPRYTKDHGIFGLIPMDKAMRRAMQDNPSGDEEEENGDRVDPRYSNLSTLKLTRCSVHSPSGTRYELLRATPNITTIDFSSLTFGISSNPPPTPPKLKSFELSSLTSYTEIGLSSAQPIFQHQHAPSLKTLSIYSCAAVGGGAAVYDQVFAPGLKLARSHLTSLDIGKCLIDHERLLEILQALPELQHLNVAFCGVGDALLQAMAGGSGVGKKVRALGLAGNDGITTTGLRIFVNSRLESTDQLAISIPVAKPKPSFGAFRPSSQTQRTSRPTQSPPSSLSASQLFTLLPPLESQFSQSISTPVPPQPLTKIDWLNLDHIEGIEPVLVDALQKKMNFVSHSLSGMINESRIRGLGGFAWDADYGEGCPSDGRGKCGLRRRPGGKDAWYVHHGCRVYEAPPSSQANENSRR